MIDSHCHLNFENIKNNMENIISIAIDNNITSILSINTDPDNFDEHYELILKYKSLFITYGLHPEYVTNLKNISKDVIKKYCKKNKVIGIGETGLDFYHSTEYKKEQYTAFEQHIEASIENKIPLIIHQRESEKEIIDVLKSYQNNDVLSLVFHCFTGSKELRNFCLDNNYYISISGIITFKNAEELRNTLKDVPLSSILIETDSPFLSPVPFRGKPNEPSNVKYIAEYLSTFLKVSLNDIINSTDNNFYKLFSKAIRYNEISQ